MTRVGQEGLNDVAITMLPIELIDPSPDTHNSRRRDDETSLRELAASIHQHGVLQPILVTAKPDGRYDTIFGNRRLFASQRAGVANIPAVVRDTVTEREKLVLNLVENIQRRGLSSHERASSLRALADSGGGVREICRWTGKDAGTISRWLRISHKELVLQALEDGRIDIARAQYLAPIEDRESLERLIAQAQSMSMMEFAQCARSAVMNNTDYSVDTSRLADIERTLNRITVVTSAGLEHLERILERAGELRAQAVQRPTGPVP